MHKKTHLTRSVLTNVIEVAKKDNRFKKNGSVIRKNKRNLRKRRMEVNNQLVQKDI